MRSSLFVLMVVTAGCGVVAEAPAPLADEGAEPAPIADLPGAAPLDEGAELEPGWYELPPEPASEFVGDLTIERGASVIGGKVTHRLGDQRVYLAMQWGDAEPVAFTGPLKSGDSYRALLAPPSSAITASAACRATATGVLLVYLARPGAPLAPRTDELIGASYKPTRYFSYEQTAYNQHLVWNDCQLPPGPSMPVLLQRDPRFGLMRCTEQQLTTDTCPTKPLDRTRLSKADLQVSALGALLSPTFVYRPANASVRYELNGQRVGDGFWQLSTGASSPWRPGRNTLSITIDGFAPWAAVVVLPRTRLEPRLETDIKTGSDFTLRWNRAPWADDFLVSFTPLDVPVRRQPNPRWTVTEPTLTARFEGFPSGEATPVFAPRALISLFATRSQGAGSVTPHGRGGFDLTWFESFVAPVQR